MTKITVVGEMGINHNGDLATAFQLIDLAKACGCDAVKFQKRSIEIVYPPAVQAQPRLSRWGTTLGAQKRGLEFGWHQYRELDAYCYERHMPWFASAWDVPSVEFLELFRPPYHKIASPLVTNLAVLKAVAAAGRPTFLSTGMSTDVEVGNAVSVFAAARCPLTLLHCVSLYPCPEPALNLLRIQVLYGQYGVPVGFSSHAVSPVPAILAIGAGATVVECHLTLDRASEGSDQAASLEARGMQLVVAAARSWEVAAGDGAARVLPGELENAKKLRYWEADTSTERAG